ncbi:MAG: hypothetical protein DI536_28390 [Archangium gephyra]|uniref:DUF4190 domain-containing protein n=1 Tax=Archangium gephyra TaxID=48 RepID=A0A2W5SW56_9BACT|nr:MAG: hypothetical protein DI536_28390 [Archangium gephyra]
MRDLAGARCAKHPDVQAVENCSRCGAFVCPSCLEFHLDGGIRCANCMDRDRTEKPSGRAVAALVFAVLGIQCGLLPGIVGLVLGTAELSAIERGEAPAAGRSLARGGQIIGGIAAALLAIVLIGVAFFVATKSRW